VEQLSKPSKSAKLYSPTRTTERIFIEPLLLSKASKNSNPELCDFEQAEANSFYRTTLNVSAHPSQVGDLYENG